MIGLVLKERYTLTYGKALLISNVGQKKGRPKNLGRPFL